MRYCKRIPSYIRLLSDKEVARVSDDLSMLFMLVVGSTVILCPLVYFYQVNGALWGSLLISISVAKLGVYMLGMGRGFVTTTFDPDRVNARDTQMFVTGFLLSALLCAYLSYGFLQLFEWYKGSANLPYLMYLWFAVLVLVPMGLFLYDFIPRADHVLDHILMSVSVKWDRGYPVYVDQLVFENSKTGMQSAYLGDERDVHISDFVFYDSHGKKSIRERHEQGLYTLSIDRIVTHHDYPLIPAGTDQFRLSWYSFVEKKYYSDIFPFPLEKLEIDERSFQGYPFIRAISLLLFPDGNAYLLNQKGGQVVNYIKIQSKEIPEIQIDRYYDLFMKKTDFQGTKHDLNKELEYIQNSGYIARLLRQKRYFHWQLIHNLQDSAKRFHITCFDHTRSTLTSKTVVKMALPRSIWFYINGFHFDIDIDGEVLFLRLDEFPDSKTSLLTLKITFDSKANEVLSVDLVGDDFKVAIDALEVNRTSTES